MLQTDGELEVAPIQFTHWGNIRTILGYIGIREVKWKLLQYYRVYIGVILGLYRDIGK